METAYQHWSDVDKLLRRGVLTLGPDLALVEHDGESSAETSYLLAKHQSRTVATPPLVTTMARLIGPTGLQIHMETPMWARKLAVLGVDMVALGAHAIPEHGHMLEIARGDGRQIGIFPQRTLLMVDVSTKARIEAAFHRARCRKIVYLGRRIDRSVTGPDWYLSTMYATHGHEVGSELRVYERVSDA